MTITTIDSPRIYVGTYGKYNSGSIKGAWLDLTDYADQYEFYDACLELHADESDPELMFQDWENIPAEFIHESGISAEFWDYQETVENSHLESEVFDAGMKLGIAWEQIEDRYRGHFWTPREFTQDYLEQNGMYDELPDWAIGSFDEDRYYESTLRHEFMEEGGHYFNLA